MGLYSLLTYHSPDQHKPATSTITPYAEYNQVQPNKGGAVQLTTFICCLEVQLNRL